MYTWEISEFLKNHNYLISSKDYLDIFSFNASPQIVHVKYDPYSDEFLAETNDGANWKFRVYKI